MPSIVCAECQATLKISAEKQTAMAGRKFRCPRCQAWVRVPRGEGSGGEGTALEQVEEREAWREMVGDLGNETGTEALPELETLAERSGRNSPEREPRNSPERVLENFPGEVSAAVEQPDEEPAEVFAAEDAGPIEPRPGRTWKQAATIVLPPRDDAEKMAQGLQWDGSLLAVLIFFPQASIVVGWVFKTAQDVVQSDRQVLSAMIIFAVVLAVALLLIWMYAAIARRQLHRQALMLRISINQERLLHAIATGQQRVEAGAVASPANAA